MHHWREYTIFSMTVVRQWKLSNNAIIPRLDNLGVVASRLDHIYKGPKGDRSLSDMCVMEFVSNAEREQVLKKFDKRDKSQDQVVGKLEVDRAKSQLQLKRNAALRDVEKTLKNDPRTKGKSIAIVWKKTDPKDKNREVTVDGKSVFKQTNEDMTGNFLHAFSDLKI